MLPIVGYTDRVIVLVTGASGHLGNVVVRQLLDRGHSVRCLLRRLDPPALESLDIERIQGDLFDLDAIRDACSGVDWIVHCAALISTVERDRDQVQRVNVQGTRNMIDAALSAGVDRFVYVSSVEALDLEVGGAPIGPDRFDPDHSIMTYGRTKATATLEVLAAVRDRGLPAVVGIPSALVGPYDFGTARIVEMVHRFLKRRLPAYIDGGFDFVDVRDVAAGLITAAEKGNIGEAYLLTGRLASYFEITEILERVSGVPMSHMRVPYWLALPFTALATAVGLLLGRQPIYTPNGLKILQSWPHFDIEKSTADLGYRPRAIEETLRDTVAWVQGSFVAVTEETG